MRRFAAVVAMIAAAIVGAGAAAPAAAAPLGQYAVYVVDEFTGQLFLVVLSGSVEPVGPAPDPVLPAIQAMDADVDTGVGYAVRITDAGPALLLMDVTTGRYETIDVIREDGVALGDCRAISYRHDELVASCTRDDDGQEVFGLVDPFTAAFTEIATFPTLMLGFGTGIDGGLRGIDDLGAVYAIERTTGARTLLYSLTGATFTSLGFGGDDSALTLSRSGALWVFDPEGTAQSSVRLTHDGLRQPSALMVVGRPQDQGAEAPTGGDALLPATGAEPLPLLALASVLALLGAVALAGGGRRAVRPTRRWRSSV